ncbi:MAG: hypothetical protein J6O39_00240 [Treponema sp.]|nr:hypothetical protein [Treponema sp.]
MQMKWAALCIAAVMYVLAVAFRSRRVYFSTLAAFIIILLGMIFPGELFVLPKDILAMDDMTGMRLYAFAYSIGTAVQWNLLMIYTGVMIVTALLVYSKVPEKLSFLLLGTVRIPALSMVLVFISAGLLSAFIGAFPALVVTAPVVVSFSRQLKFNPAFFLLSVAAVCSLEGSAFYFASPASFLFSEFSGMALFHFFIVSGKVSLFFIAQAALLAGALFFGLYFSRTVKGEFFVARVRIVSLVPVLLFALTVAALIACSMTPVRFVYVSGFAVLIIAIFGLAWFYLFQKKTIAELFDFLKNLDWNTVFYMIGIFIVAGALKKSGVFDDLAGIIVSHCGTSRLRIFVIVFVVSVFAGAFLDIVPYLILLMPVIGIVSNSYCFSGNILAAAMVAGSCIGTGFTPFTSLTMQSALSVLKKENCEIKLLDWVKNVLPAAVIMAAVYAVLLWFLWK